VSSRKLWTHPIKNKNPPIAYIDKFLNRHGIRTTNPSKAIITTSKTGYLAKSREFEEIVSGQQYVIQPTNDDSDIFGDLLPDHVKATVTTDGGGKLFKSHELTKSAIHTDMSLIQQQRTHHHKMELWNARTAR
jgi:hypothetical protein